MSLRPCYICASPYKTEILKLRKQGMSVKVIYEKYKDLMKYTGSNAAFWQVLDGHIKMKHNPDFLIVPKSVASAATIENFGQRMLELGMEKISGMTGESIALKDVIQAQKLVLDSKKLKITEDAMMGMLAKLFAPPTLKVVEGEIIDERPKAIGTE